LKSGLIAALRQRDEDRIAGRFRIVLAQFIPQSPGIVSHGRVIVVIQPGTLSVELRSQHLLFKRIPVATETLLNDELQESTKTLAADEDIACQDFLKLCLDHPGRQALRGR